MYIQLPLGSLFSLRVLLILSIFLISVVNGSSSSSSLTIRIPPTQLLPNPHILPATTHTTLTSLSPTIPLLKARLTRSGKFVFHDLDNLLRPSRNEDDSNTEAEEAVKAQAKSTDGGKEKMISFLLDVHSRDYVFAPFRVDISADGKVVGVWETYRGNPWDNKGVERIVERDAEGKNVIVEAKVVGMRGFYEERAKCMFFYPIQLFTLST